jgi:hypothetical protein
LAVETWYSSLCTCTEGSSPDAELYQSWTETEPAVTAALDVSPAVDSFLNAGNWKEGNSFNLNGYIAEFIYWDAVLDSAEIQSWRDYVTSKYGITWV